MHDLEGTSSKFNSKCAEIYFHTSEFTIRCHCGMTTLEYNVFLLHFHNQHIGANKLQTTELSDPLHLDEAQQKHVDNELPTDLAIVEQTSVAVKEECELAKNVECLSEPEIDNVLPLTKNDLRQITITENEKLTSTTQTVPTVIPNVDVDWSKPYAPNLLKNHDKRPYKPRNKPNACSYCGRTFRRRYQLETHLNIHTGLMPHQCDICGRQFRAATTLARHLKTHEQRETFKCQFCDKHFNHRAALVSHELRHTQQRTVPCSECNKCFYTSNQMDTHRRKAHQDATPKPLPFACDICTKSYRSASMLSTHKSKNHYRLAKHTCEQCNKKFIDETRLKAHRLVHVEVADATP